MLFSYSHPDRLSGAEADQLEPLALKKHPGPQSHPWLLSSQPKTLELSSGAVKRSSSQIRGDLGWVDQEGSEGGDVERL